MLSLNDGVVRQGAFTLEADLAVQSGSKVAVIGPSGAGKSTLINALCGFVPLASGTITLDGQDITQASPSDRQMAMLFQDNNLFPHLTLAQNVGLGLRASLRLDATDKALVERALRRVGLAGLEDRKPSALSGGQQSRAALARVVLQGKPWMILDEPFAALGPALRADMLDLVAEVADETNAGVLMVTHSPEDARRLADQTIFVADGRTYGPVATSELLDNPPPALRAYLGA